jgi:hypothetical protein
MIAKGQIVSAQDESRFSDDPTCDFGLNASEKLQRLREGARWGCTWIRRRS